MLKNEKEYLDSLWVDTEVYTWLKIMSEEGNKPAEIYANKLQLEFEEKYGEAAIACGMYVFWKGKELAEKLSKALKTWGRYMEYMETFSDEMNRVMYETDIFDSYMAKCLQH